MNNKIVLIYVIFLKFLLKIFLFYFFTLSHFQYIKKIYLRFTNSKIFITMKLNNNLYSSLSNFLSTRLINNKFFINYFLEYKIYMRQYLSVNYNLKSWYKYNFIIIIDMSSGSLISSLFRDNSFASRSSSMFQKSFSSIDNDNNKNRSQSALR